MVYGVSATEQFSNSAMNNEITLKKLPWGSLALLLVTYSTLGWLLSAFKDPWFVWVIIIIGVLLLAGSLSSPWSKIRDDFARLFKSDNRAFFVAVVAAFLTVVIVSWLHVFAHAFVVTSAVLLVRLDVQTAGFTESQAFWILTIVSLVGLGLGGLAHQILTLGLDRVVLQILNILEFWQK